MAELAPLARAAVAAVKLLSPRQLEQVRRYQSPPAVVRRTVELAFLIIDAEKLQATAVKTPAVLTRKLDWRGRGRGVHPHGGLVHHNSPHFASCTRRSQPPSPLLGCVPQVGFLARSTLVTDMQHRSKACAGAIAALQHHFGLLLSSSRRLEDSCGDAKDDDSDASSSHAAARASIEPVEHWLNDCKDVLQKIRAEYVPRLDAGASGSSIATGAGAGAGAGASASASPPSSSSRSRSLKAPGRPAAGITPLKHERVHRASAAAGSLLKWCLAQLRVADAVRNMGPQLVDAVQVVRRYTEAVAQVHDAKDAASSADSKCDDAEVSLPLLL